MGWALFQTEEQDKEGFLNMRGLRMKTVKFWSLFNCTYGLLFDLGLLFNHPVPGFPVSSLMSYVVGKGVGR